MKPVEMRHDSDCTACALAALLEVPIEEMPDFWKAKDVSTFCAQIERWLRPRGYHWYYSTYGGTNCPFLRDFAKEKRDSPTNSFPPRGYWIGRISSVDRLRDNDPCHVVVMKDHRPVFNPGGTVKEALDGPWFLIGYYLLVPLDPSK